MVVVGRSWPAMRVTKSFPARIPARLAMATTERSMPPVSMATIMAMESSPSSGKEKEMESKL